MVAPVALRVVTTNKNKTLVFILTNPLLLFSGWRAHKIIRRPPREREGHSCAAIDFTCYRD